MRPPVDTLPPDDRKPNPASTIDASSLSEAVKATIPSKRTKYDASRAVDDLYRKHAGALRGKATGALNEQVTFAIYSIYRPRFVKIAKKYRSLSSLFGEEDLQQEALAAILEALRKYKHAADIQMKFSTYLEWKIRNIFQRAIGGKDNYVEIYSGDGAFKKTLDWGAFVEEKKALEDAGCTSTTKKRFCYFSEALWDQDLEAKLKENAFGAVHYDYGESSDGPEDGENENEEAEGKGGEEVRDEEPGTEAEGVTAPSVVSGPVNGLNLQMIDGLYRQWARSPGRGAVTESDPIVLKIYGLYREQGEELFLPFRNDGTAMSVEDVRRSILSAIVHGLTRHDHDAVPGIPFSLSLRVAMRRSIQRGRTR